MTAATKGATGLQRHCLRTYRHGGEFQPELTIAQACHAALAASGLVDSCSIPAAGFSYTEGLPAWNNPVQQVLDEANELWPGCPIWCLLSLGTGIPQGDSLRSLPRPMARLISEFAIEAAVTERVFETAHSDLVISGRYTRVSVSRGLDDSELHPGMPYPLVDQATRAYIDAEGSATRRRVALILRPYEPPRSSPPPPPVQPDQQEQPGDVASPPYVEDELGPESYASVMGEKEGPSNEKRVWSDEKEC